LLGVKETRPPSIATKENVKTANETEGASNGNRYGIVEQSSYLLPENPY
jgi:hypothetical protein